MNVLEALSLRIVELCDQHDITVNKLCTISGVTQSTVDSILKGKSKNPGIATIKKLCDGLDITVFDFFNSPLFINLEQEVK